jgi:predicted GNAT superfamily acetyltransferase
MAELRDLTVDDLAAAHVINQANVPDVGEVSPERLAWLQEMTSVSMGVFDDDGSMRGFCMVFPPGTDYDSTNYRWFMERYDDAYYLDRVAFSETARRRGLGTRLYAAVEQRIVDHAPAIARLVLEVNSNPPNEGSLAFHTGRGYRELERRPTPYGIEVAMFEKPLR